jgi:CRISPR/Cas system Type II protein with McrA/HNH and RuvC-like nuclease domain
MRRQTGRRARRVASAFRVLQRAGPLPPFPEGADPADPLARHELINRLDSDLASGVPGLIDPACEHRSRSVYHYRLRALAIRQDLPPYAVGRALLHIAQRRGFKSGRIEEASGSGKDKEQEAARSRFTLLRIPSAAESRAPEFESRHPRSARVRPPTLSIRGSARQSSAS